MATGKLAKGMTVQTHGRMPDCRVAYCVRCGWESDPLKYEAAQRVAQAPTSHPCKEPR